MNGLRLGRARAPAPPSADRPRAAGWRWALLALTLLPHAAAAADVSVRQDGSLSTTARQLRGAPGSTRAGRGQLDLAGHEDVTVGWAGAWAARLHVWGNYDARNSDDNRLRFDDLYLSYYTDRLELRLGYQIMSWKSLQTYSPADLPNSLDYGLDFVAPSKVGTPALRASYTLTFGVDHTLTVYEFPELERSILPRRGSPLYLFAGQPGLRYDADAPEYGGRGGRYRQQVAVTYHSNLGGLADVLAFYFDGYRRYPLSAFSGVPPDLVVRDRYPLIHAFGGTVQREVGQVLVSAEGVYTRYNTAAVTPSGRDVQGYWQWAAGAERTITSIFGTRQELALELEVAGDSLAGRRPEDMESGHVFRSNAFLSARWTFNDTARRAVRALAVIDWREGDLYAAFGYRQELTKPFSVELSADGWLIAESALARTLRHGNKASVSLIGSW